MTVTLSAVVLYVGLVVAQPNPQRCFVDVTKNSQPGSRVSVSVPCVGGRRDFSVQGTGVIALECAFNFPAYFRLSADGHSGSCYHSSRGINLPKSEDFVSSWTKPCIRLREKRIKFFFCSNRRSFDLDFEVYCEDELLDGTFPRQFTIADRGFIPCSQSNGEGDGGPGGGDGGPGGGDPIPDCGDFGLDGCNDCGVCQ